MATLTSHEHRNVGTHRPLNLNALDWLSLTLLLIGGLNWGLVGAFGFDLVAYLFGPMSTLSRVIYMVVGLAAVYEIFLMARLGRRDTR